MQIWLFGFWSLKKLKYTRAGQGPVARPNPEKTEEKKNELSGLIRVCGSNRSQIRVHKGINGQKRGEELHPRVPEPTRSKNVSFCVHIYTEENMNPWFFSCLTVTPSGALLLTSYHHNTNDHLHLFFFLTSLSYLTHKTPTQTKKKKSTSIDLHPSSLSLHQIMKYCMSRSERY
jgi:hypothetical protein